MSHLFATNPDGHTSHTSYLGTSAASAAGGLWMSAAEVLAHGPGWALVPPLVIACASLAGAFVSGRRVLAETEIRKADAEQLRRHKEEIHRTQVRLMLSRLTNPS